MKIRIKDAIAWLCTAACFGIALAIIIIVWNMPATTPRESNLLNILIFIFSSLFALASGYLISRCSSSEKIDTIATQSTEKMLHLSMQIQSLIDYLNKTVSMAQEEGGAGTESILLLYKHRVTAAATMTASIFSSNETFRSDWLGVVSDATKDSIESKYAKLRQYIRDTEKYERLIGERESSKLSNSEETKVTDQIREVEERIEIARYQLPIQPSPMPPIPRAPAVFVQQSRTTATEKKQTGSLTISVLRPVYIATGTGHLSPHMTRVPWVTATMTRYPEGLDVDNFRYSPGTGTVHDFHINLKSLTYGVTLPTGDYHFDYSAEADPVHDTAESCGHQDETHPTQLESNLSEG